MAYQLEVVDLQTLPPAGTVLSEREQAFYSTLKLPKRQAEWLGGRLALKKLLCAHLGGALTDFTVLASGGVGKPTVSRTLAADTHKAEADEGENVLPTASRVLREGRACQLFGAGIGNPGSGAFSITHSNGFAVAALSAEHTYIGIDLEQIAPRIKAWKTDFFHPSELTGDSNEFLTALWTQKEAVVKLLGSGLTINSFDVRCVNGQAQFFGRALQIYQSLGSPQITLETRPLIPGFCFSIAVGK